MEKQPIGKPESATKLAADSAAENTNNCRRFRLFVNDKKTGLRFLVDSGADVSLIPYTSKHKFISDYKLYAANNTTIGTFGTEILNLDLGLRREFQFPFIVAKISKPILGADFLNKFNLLIDIKHKRLIDGATNLAVSGDIAPISINESVNTTNSLCKYSDLFSMYPDITKPNFLISNVKHNVKHHIITKGQPINCKAR